MKYRTNPCEIEAVQWLGDNTKDILDFTKGNENVQFIDGKLMIHTLEGDMLASVGDFIIRGLRGEFYPCKPDVFEKKYHPIEEGNS